MAKSSGSSISAVGFSLTAGSPGSVYVTGYFSSPTITFGTTTLTNASGNNDLFLVKYDSSGSVLWAKRAGGNDQDYAYAVTTDQSGSVYLAGIFQSPTITFGGTVLANAGMYNMFLVKYAADGSVLWAKSAGGSSADEATSVAADLSGSVYMTGYFGSPVLTFGATTLTTSAWPIIFLAKYNEGTLHIPNVNQPAVGISLFPNPVTNELMITSRHLITQVTITNLFGQMTLNNYYQTEAVEVDVSGLVSGIYLVKVNGTEVQKFVKQ